MWPNLNFLTWAKIVKKHTFIKVRNLDALGNFISTFMLDYCMKWQPKVSFQFVNRMMSNQWWLSNQSLGMYTINKPRSFHEYQLYVNSDLPYHQYSRRTFINNNLLISGKNNHINVSDTENNWIKFHTRRNHYEEFNEVFSFVGFGSTNTKSYSI
jgi:hypothetical protein